jgi:3-dehydroquinate dehydratase
MGSRGRISRLATIKLGGYMTYAAPDGGKETAPGQIPVSVMSEMLARLNHAD